MTAVHPKAVDFEHAFGMSSSPQSNMMYAHLMGGDNMLNPTTIMAEALGNQLEDYYKRTFGPEEPTYPSKLNLVARMALDVIANSDALYHDVQHTMLERFQC
jgi:hypothetical protein